MSSWRQYRKWLEGDRKPDNGPFFYGCLTPVALCVVVVLVLSLLGGCAHEDPWTRTDTALYSGYVVALAADTHITNELIRGYDFTYERNPVVVAMVGRRPTQGELITGAAAAALVNYLIARSLPQKQRRWYLGLWASGHAYMTIDNYEFERELTEAQ